MKRIFLAGAAFGILAACATASVEPADDGVIEETMTETGDAGSVETILIEKSEFDLAMETVETLVEAKNEQTAIDRLTQLLGRPDLTDEEKQIALLKRGTIRLSDRGFDTWSAIKDFEELTNTYGDEALDGVAMEQLHTARGKATSLSSLIQQAEISRVEKFRAMFQLGDHQEAVDLMLATNLNPGNEYLIAMEQIGWLCEGEGYTGPIYAATSHDGNDMNLQFCDFGK